MSTEILGKDWVESQLRRHSKLGAGLERVEELSATASEVAEVRRYRLLYGRRRQDDTCEHVLVKASRLGTRALPGREVAVYEQIPQRMARAPLVPCHHALFQAETNQFVLFLGDLTETHKNLPCSLPPTRREALAVAEVLASVHAAYWNRTAELVRPLAVIPSPYDLRRVLSHAECYFPRLKDLLGDRLSVADTQMFSVALQHHTAWLIDRFARGPLTLLHGDAHMGNFLIPRDSDSAGRVYAIDWQTPPWVWTVGMGVSDLVYLMARYWPASNTRELAMPLLMHYFRRLKMLGVSGYDWPTALTDFRSSCLLNLYIVIEEACRTDPQNWYPQLMALSEVVRHFDCLAIFRP